MACFLAPTAEAVIVSIVRRQQKKKEETALHIENHEAETKMTADVVEEGKIPFSRKLGWLSNMLWGGSFLLAVEHIWHGEVVPWPPFLTAMNNPADVMPMLQEIATVGTAMAVLVTAVWGVMLAVAHGLERKRNMDVTVETEG